MIIEICNNQHAPKQQTVTLHKHTALLTARQCSGLERTVSFIQQGHIQLTKGESEDISNVAFVLFSNLVLNYALKMILLE